MPHENKNIEKDLTHISDFDILDLYIRSVEVFAEQCTRLQMEEKRCFELGQVLWEKSLEARDRYRKSHPDKEARR